MKQFIIDTLDLEDLRPEDIGNDEPLFSNRIGLDSIDGLELEIALRKKFNVTGKPVEKSQQLTVNALVAFLSSKAQP
jgi:acyl carrier protein